MAVTSTAFQADAHQQPHFAPHTSALHGAAPQQWAASDIQALRDLAVSLATDAGEMIRAKRPQHVVVAQTKSTASDPVTEMDRATEKFLRDSIRQHRPYDAIMGEEGSNLPGTSGLTWILDPIDGTVNYVYGVADFAVSVAVVAGPPDPEQWTQLAGCVHTVNTGRTYHAGLGLGAMRDGARLGQITAPPTLAGTLTATGFGYASTRRAKQAQVLTQVLPQVRDIRRLGSSAIDLCITADGSVDMYYERGLNAWDFAAASLIASEAGVRVTGLRGRRANSDMLVAGRGPAVDQMVGLLERMGADSDE